MPLADYQTISVETKTFGLWRIYALARVARFIPSPLRMLALRLVVPTAGVKVRVAGQAWERHPLKVSDCAVGA